MSLAKKIIIRQAKESEIEWINTQYDEIGFVASHYDSEYIVIAEINNKKCGLGRITKIDDDNLELGGIYVLKDYRGMGVADHIVGHLSNYADNQHKIWCLPFENLNTFYSKFGFVAYQKLDFEVPEKVISKFRWCNDTYDKKVLLLAK